MKIVFAPKNSTTIRDGSVSGRSGRLLAAFICALGVCVFLLPSPAAGAMACPVHGLTIHGGKAGVDVVGLSAQGFTCTKAARVARQVAQSLAAGRSLNLSGAAGIAIATTTSCEKCATHTQVSLSYPDGTIKLTIKGATKMFSGAGASIPLPKLPFLRIPGFHFPGFPRIPNLPNFPNPVNPRNGEATV